MLVLHRVEIRRRRADMTRSMSTIREWLDQQRFEPDTFRSITKGETVVFRLDFKIESESQACAEKFDGRVLSLSPSAAPPGGLGGM
jgi:hypothetical protein